ncbi:hypothetical protein ACFY3G_02060 [Streptomyces phaeochromogenes]
MEHCEACGQQLGTREPEQGLLLIDWLLVIRFIIEWLLQQG